MPRLLLLIPLLSMLSSLGPGQEAESTISLDVRRVILYASVTDPKTREFAGNLSKENFQVFEDGKPREILQFSEDKVPAAVGLIIDNSQSIGPRRMEVIAAAKEFIRASNPQDELFVIHFSDDVRFALPSGMPFTSNPEVLENALDTMRPRGRTALYDAIGEGLRRLRESKLTKKALVVISDGGDNQSMRTRDDAVKAANLSGAIFYGIGIYRSGDRDADPGVLKGMAKDTGGLSFFPKSIDRMKAICAEIAADLRNHYTLVYAPPERAPDADAFHKIEVKARDDQGRKLRVRTRTGYYDTAS